MKADATDKRKNNKFTSRRHPAPQVEIVAMDTVPPPPPPKGSIGHDLYAQICQLKAGVALKVTFESDKHGDYVRIKLRSLAKKDKQFLSSSSTADGNTRWFWLEKL